MTLPAGQISLSQVNAELGRPAAQRISMNDNDVRLLAQRPTGQISMSQLRGKSNFAWVQQGAPLAGKDMSGFSRFGEFTVISDDGNTLATSSTASNYSTSKITVFTRSGGVWAQQGPDLVSEYATDCMSLAISKDGNTLAAGFPNDKGSAGQQGAGSFSVFVRSGGVWTEQANRIKLEPYEYANIGTSISLSDDGNTLAVGGSGADRLNGAAWVFTRKSGVWSKQFKLTPPAGGAGRFGDSICLSADGNTVAVGSPNTIGSCSVFVRIGNSWSQLGDVIVGSGGVGDIQYQGDSVSISADGSTLAVGARADDNGVGAVWVFYRNGDTWIQMGGKLVCSGLSPKASSGTSVCISNDGNTVVAGAPGDQNRVGSVATFKRVGSKWQQDGQSVVGTSGISGQSGQGFSVYLSGDGGTLAVGCPNGNSYAGAVLTFVRR